MKERHHSSNRFPSTLIGLSNLTARDRLLLETQSTGAIPKPEKPVTLIYTDVYSTREFTKDEWEFQVVRLYFLMTQHKWVENHVSLLPKGMNLCLLKTACAQIYVEQ
ncbi:unnamed protein product [Schistosoma bovis]|nr:unnamed protein product [Schistosoma bovis]